MITQSAEGGWKEANPMLMQANRVNEDCSTFAKRWQESREIKGQQRAHLMEMLASNVGYSYEQFIIHA